MREIKSDIEIVEIERAEDIAYEMQTTAMKMAKSGVYEYEIAGALEGITLKHNGHLSFHSIISINGQTLHNHTHNNVLTKGEAFAAYFINPATIILMLMVIGMTIFTIIGMR